ncbi:MAG: hypothetical protein EGP82_00125 [Odoribacter splanchnicus]|nr:hypothetical protein [Odoribacter splanchnicus]
MSKALDYGPHPYGMDMYLDNYGYHFSKKAAEYAIEQMINADANPEKHKHYTDEQVRNILKQYGITIKNDKGYDVCYTYNMFYSDYHPEGMKTEQDIAKNVKLYLDDPDGYAERSFCEYYTKCMRMGIPFLWEKMM